MDAKSAIEHDERRAARDRWRAGGGSRRRPLRSFSTEAERKAKRAELRAEREAALAAVATDDGARADWIETCRLNPHLGANNAAIVAVRLPGQVVGTVRYWRANGARILRGEHAALYLTGGPHTKFAPVAAFAACQTDAAECLAAIENPREPATDDGELPF